MFKREKDVSDFDKLTDGMDEDEKQLMRQLIDEESEVEKPKGSRFRIFCLGVVAMCMMCGLITYVYSTSILLPKARLVVNKIEMQQSNANLHTKLWYKDTGTGEWQLLETLYDGEQTKWIEYKNIPSYLRNAAVAVEDKRFWEHNGVDWFRTASATWHTIGHIMTGTGSIEGGSTITQQLIKNMTGNADVSVKRKMTEIIEANMLDSKMTKEEILTMYLNNIYFGRNSYGIYSAAYTYFDKDVSELDLAECVSLIGITNNPSYYDPFNHPEHTFTRAKKILFDMSEQGYITDDELKSALIELGYNSNGSDYVLNLDNSKVVFANGSLTSIINEGGEATDNKYNWYVDAVIEQLVDDFVDKGYSKKQAIQHIYHGGLDVYTTYNPEMQKAIEDVYENPENYTQYVSKSGQQLQSGMTVIDNETGCVIAMAGGLGEKDGNRLWNRATDSLLQPASTIKPFSAYIPCMENHLIGENSSRVDKPFKQVNDKDYPSNDYDGYKGQMSMKDAVAYSTNTIPMFLVDEYGVDKTYDWLSKFKLNLDGKNDKTLSALSLGGLHKGTSVQSIASMYATLPNRGNYKDAYYYTYVEDSYGDIVIKNDVGKSTELYSKKTADSMTNLLSGVVEYGTASGYNVPDGFVGKTGSTNDYHDQWFAGYNDSITAVVWCGYDKSEAIPVINDTGHKNVAVEIWSKVINDCSLSAHS